MADQLNLHVVYRPINSDTAPTCELKDPQDWKYNCVPLPPLAQSTLQPEGSNFVLQDKALLESITIQSGVETYIVVEDIAGTAGKYKSTTFTTEPSGKSAQQQAQEYLEKLRAGEVEKPQGSILQLEIGGHGSFGEETEPFPYSTILPGVKKGGGDNVFEGGGVDIALRILWPHIGWRKYASFVNASIQGSWSWGTVNNHYTAQVDEEGSWNTWTGGLFFGLRLDAQTIASFWDKDLAWNVFFQYDTPLLAGRGFHAHASLNGGALARDHDFRENLLVPFVDAHLFTLGGVWCPFKSMCFGLAGFARRQQFDFGNDHTGFHQDDFGGQVVFNFFQYYGGGNSHVTPTPIIPKTKPAPLPQPTPKPVQAPPPPKEPEPERGAPVVPQIKDELTLSGGATFREGKATIDPATLEQVHGVNNEIETFYKKLTGNGFLADQPLYIVVDGHTNSHDSAAYNLKLSKWRSSAFSGAQQTDIDNRNLTAQKNGEQIFPFPPHINFVPRGFGETQLIHLPNGKEDVENSRRVVVHIFTNQADLNRFLNTTAPKGTPPIKEIDLATATKNAEALKNKLKTKTTKTMFDQGVLYLAIQVKGYRSNTEIINQTVQRAFSKVLQAMLSQQKFFKNLGDKIPLRIGIQPDIASAPDTSLDRINAAKQILLKFGVSPVPGDTALFELPPDKMLEDYIKEQQRNIVETSQETNTQIASAINSKNSKTVDGQSVALYAFLPTFEDNTIALATRRALHRFRIEHIGAKTGYVEFYYPPAATADIDLNKVLLFIGNNLGLPIIPVKYVKAPRPTVVIAVSDGAVRDTQKLEETIKEYVLSLKR